MRTLALLIALASPDLGPDPGQVGLFDLGAPDASPPTCGWAPARADQGAPSETTVVYPADRLGCGVAPAGPHAWKAITRIAVAGLHLKPTGTVLQVVFLDAQGRRVLPTGRPLRFDMRFKARHRGVRKVPAEHRDGVFTFTLPRNHRAAPCESHLFLRMDGAAGVIEHWLDDWLYGC
ncbi:MAG: hypothetical protein H6702_15395 [Myxococcales bacterium]|nr:hypothetical protein [Myxococcales bacterium]